MLLLKKKTRKSKMTNYIIDGSVYTYPFHNIQPDFNEASNLYRDVVNLNFILFKKQDLYYKQTGCKHYFLLYEDIKLFLEIKDHYSPKRYTVQSGIEDKTAFETERINNKIRESIRIVETIISRLGYRTRNPNVMGHEQKQVEHVMLDQWFDIEDVSFKSDREPLLPADILKEIPDNKQRENFRKNLAITAALSKCVYRKNDIHGIIISSNIPRKEFQFKMLLLILP